MDENNVEVMDAVETTEVAETTKTDDNGVKLDAKTLIATVAVAGAVIGATSRIGEKAVDGACQGIYNLTRMAQDKLAESKLKREEKKAEREAKYQEEKAKKAAEKNNEKK